MANLSFNEFLVVQKVDAYPELRGIGIYAVDERSQQSRVLRSPQNPFITCALIMEINVVQKKSEVSGFITKIKKEALGEKTGALKPLYKELASAGINCTSAFMSGSVVLGSAAAAAPSGGTSLVVTVLSWTAFVTSAAQCVDSATRSAVALTDLYKHGRTREEIETLSKWDDNAVYSKTMYVVEGIGDVASVASLSMYARSFGLRAERDSLKLMQNMKGSKQLASFRDRFGTTSVFRTPKENEAILKMMEVHRKGVGERVFKKMLRENKTKLSELTMKKFLGDVGKGVIEKSTNIVDYVAETSFENNKTIEVNFHFIQIN